MKLILLLPFLFGCAFTIGPDGSWLSVQMGDALRCEKEMHWDLDGKKPICKQSGTWTGDGVVDPGAAELAEKAAEGAARGAASSILPVP